MCLVEEGGGGEGLWLSSHITYAKRDPYLSTGSPYRGKESTRNLLDVREVLGEKPVVAVLRKADDEDGLQEAEV